MPDTMGTCAALGLQADVDGGEQVYEALVAMLPSWEDVRVVLASPSFFEFKERQLRIASAYKQFQSESRGREWSEITQWYYALYLHCYGEEQVWRAGQHSEQSRERTRLVGDCLRVLLTQYEVSGRAGADNHDAANFIREILRATKGPMITGFDPREAYRDELCTLLDAIGRRSKQTLDAEYAKLSKVHDIPNSQNFEVLLVEPSLTSELLGANRAASKFDLRCDFRGLWGQPKWALAQNATALQQAFSDLRMFDVFKDPVNAAVEFSKICCGFVRSESSVQSQADMSVMRCAATLRRQICDGHQAQIKKCFEELLEEQGIDKSRLSARTQAKGMKRLLDKVDNLLACVGREEHFLERATELGKLKEARLELRTAGDFITDVNGVTLVLDDEDHLIKLYHSIAAKSWEKDQCMLLRVKSGFHPAKDCDDGYRDIKMFVAVSSGQQQPVPLVVEVQLQLAEFFKLKESVMHLPYEICRGDFDYAHNRK